MESVKPIHEILERQPQAVAMIIVTSAFLRKTSAAFVRQLNRATLPVLLCRESVFETLSDLDTPSGILAVIRQPQWNQGEIFLRSTIFGLYGECLQDPTNVGTVIRTAAAFGMDAVWLSGDSADMFNPKVVRAAAGTLLRLPVFVIPGVAWFKRHRCEVLAAESSGAQGRPIETCTTIPARAVIAVGNEGRGLSEAALKQAALRFHIPIDPTVESLNVAASAAIAVFYFKALPRGDQR